jgi:hypothetical protein
MSSGVNCGRIGIALFAVLSFLPTGIRAKDFISNPFGFQISLPPGYREQHSDVVNLIAEFIEPQSNTGEAPITIDIRHTGKNFNPADKTAIPDLPRQKSSTSTSEKRQWRDLELPVIRQESAPSASDRYVYYSIVFPLNDDGINLIVQGQKEREKDVARVFDNCVQQFVNLKPYVAVAANGQPVEVHTMERILANVVLPVVTGAIALIWIVKVRKARSRAATLAVPQAAIDLHDVRTPG